MIISATKIQGAFLIRPERLEDDRGFFARTYCQQEFSAAGIDVPFVQRSVSSNKHCGTLRGMHFQAAPHEESKLVSCTAGSISDAIIDLRPSSSSFRQWLMVVLDAENLDSLFIPAGCAHGFITREDNTIVRYDISTFYAPESSRGIRFDDPAFHIEWPFPPTVISARDLAFPPFGV